MIGVMKGENYGPIIPEIAGFEYAMQKLFKMLGRKFWCHFLFPGDPWVIRKSFSRIIKYIRSWCELVGFIGILGSTVLRGSFQQRGKKLKGKGNPTGKAPLRGCSRRTPLYRM